MPPASAAGEGDCAGCSGYAGVLGGVLTRLGGTATASGTPTLEDGFSLADYPFGIVIAAIFGLTPGLLLARLRQQTDEYKEELARTGAGGEKPASELAGAQVQRTAAFGSRSALSRRT